VKVLVDGTPLIQGSGIGRYTKDLLAAMLRLDAANQYTAYAFAPRLPRPLPVEADNLRYRLIRPLPRKLYDLLHRKLHVGLPVDVLARARPDLAFFTNYAVFPLVAPAKSVVVIYDLAFRRHGAFFTDRHRRFLERFVPQALERASAVVTISEFSKREIEDEYGVEGDRITVAPCAVDTSTFAPAPPAALARLKARYDVPDRYFLSVGTFEPRKNLVRLLEAFAGLPEAVRVDHPLILCGGPGWRDAEMAEALDGLRRRGVPVHHLGYVSDADLPALYSGAVALVFPSLYEGFGLPPLEAMACGTPVITSDHSSLPEVVGEAAMLVDPTDVSDISAAMERLIGDPELAVRLRSAGRTRAAAYNWTSSARAVLSLFDALVPDGLNGNPAAG
jgi:glycosyltransferase involved in cell wall biosynthesis